MKNAKPRLSPKPGPQIGKLSEEYPGIAMLIISSDPNCQGFKIQSHGDVRRKEAVKSGLWLVAEEWVGSENCPF